MGASESVPRPVVPACRNRQASHNTKPDMRSVQEKVDAFEFVEHTESESTPVGLDHGKNIFYDR